MGFSALNRLGSRGVSLALIVALATPPFFFVSEPEAFAQAASSSAAAGGSGGLISLSADMPRSPVQMQTQTGFQRAMSALFSCPQAAGQALNDIGVRQLDQRASRAGRSVRTNLNDNFTLGVSDRPCAQPASPISQTLPQELSCTSPQLKSGNSFDARKARILLSQLQPELDALTCREQRMSAIERELTCLSEGMRTLEREAQNMNNYLNQNFAKFREDMGKIEEVESDYQAQISFVNSRLNSIEGSATPGIAQMADQLSQAVAGFPAEMAMAQGKVRELQVQKQAFEQMKLNYTMRQAAQCVRNLRRGGENGYYCVREAPGATPGAPPRRQRVPVSFLEHVQCMVSQKAVTQTNRNGQQIVESVENVSNQGTQNADLTALMDQVFAALPPEQAPRNQEEAQSMANSVPAGGYIQTPEQLERRFGSQLSSLNKEGFDVSGRVLQAFRSCHAAASREVQSAQGKNPNNVIESSRIQLQNLEDTRRAELSQTIDRYAEMYADAVQSLTLERPQLPIAPACRTDPTRAASCLREMEQALRGVIRGENKYGNVALRVQGTNPARAVTFVCKGLTGCKADLDRFIRNRTQHLQQIGGIKQQYVTQVRTNANKVVTDGRAALAPRINELRDRLRLVARALSAARVPDPSLDVGSVPSEELQFDEKGLPIAPQSVLGLLGAGAGGADGIPNINEAALMSAGGRVTAGREEISRQRARIGSAIAAIEGLQQSCPQQAIENLITRAETAWQDFNSAGCRTNSARCNRDDEAMAQVVNTMAAIRSRGATSYGSASVGESDEGELDIDSRLAALESGVTGLCGNPDDTDHRQARCNALNACSQFPCEVPALSGSGATQSLGTQGALDVALATDCGATLTGQRPSTGACQSSFSRMDSYLRSLNSAMGRAEGAGSASGGDDN